MLARLSEMSNIFKSSCTLLSKVVTTYTTLATLRLWKVAKVVQSCIGHFPDAGIYASNKISDVSLYFSFLNKRLNRNCLTVLSGVLSSMYT